MIEAIRERCPDPKCGAYTGHSPFCSLATAEYKAEQMVQYYSAWLRDVSHYREKAERLREQVTLWQGKFAILKHENNQLRKKIRESSASRPKH